MIWLKENWFWIGMTGAALIIAAAFWQYFVVIPREREVQERLSDNDRQLQLETCLESADYTYQAYWSSQCEAEGKKSNCTVLTQYHADQAEKLKQQEKDNCFQQYK